MFQLLALMTIFFAELPANGTAHQEASREAVATTAYETLSISRDEAWKIGEILRTMADNNVFSLLFEKKRLEKLGHEIGHVHPIRFIGTVFSDPACTKCMFVIRQSSFKWNGFIDGFRERFKEEIKNNNIYQYLPGLAETLNVDLAELRSYVDGGDFEGMVLYLMRMSRKNRR